MSYKRSHDESSVATDSCEPTVPKRKLDENIQLLSPSESPLISSTSPPQTSPQCDRRSAQSYAFPPMPSSVTTSSSVTSLSTPSSHSATDQLITSSAKHVVRHKMSEMSETSGSGGDSPSMMDTCDAYKPSSVVMTSGDDNDFISSSGVGRGVSSMSTTSTPTTAAGTVESEEEDDCDTDPDIIIPYLKRFQESYQTSLSIYSSRLEKLELSDALKCTNDLFAVAIDNYQKEHNGFAHKTAMDLSGVHNVRREFDELLAGPGSAGHSYHTMNSSSGADYNNSFRNSGDIKATNSSNSNTSNEFMNSNNNYNYNPNDSSGGWQSIPGLNYGPFDDKLAKVIAFMCQIEAQICRDMRQIYCSYERLLEALVTIEYRLAIIIEMFHHMTDVEPQKFLPCLPFIQNVPDLIGYINSLYDADNELQIRDESSNERMQAIVDQFRAMHKRIRDAMDGLHALSCIIMEKKTEVIDRVHTFYKKAEQIFFSQPPFVFQTKDNTSRCL